MIAVHFRHPLFLDFPHSADKVLDRVVSSTRKIVEVFLFELRSNLFWLSKAAPQEFLRLIFDLSRALLLKLDRTYTEIQEGLIALLVVDYPAVLLIAP